MANNDQQDFDHNQPEMAGGEHHLHFDDSYERAMAAQQVTFDDVKEHALGPVLSVVLHIVAIVFIVAMSGGAEEQKTYSQIQEVVVEIKAPEKEPEPPPPPEEEPPETSDSVDIERPTTSTVSEAVSESTTEDIAVGAAGEAVDVPDVISVRASNSPLKMSGLAAARGGGAGGRGKYISKYGGSGKKYGDTDKAVTRALGWLKDHQNPEGDWGDTDAMKPILTGLALLVYLAHGETPQSPDYGATVLKAILRCVDYAKSTNEKCIISADQEKGYANAIVTYALSEAYGMTQMPAVGEAATKLIEGMIKGINEYGVFNYNYSNGTTTSEVDAPSGQARCDLSISGWHYQALKAAKAAGVHVEGLEKTIERSVDGIKGNASGGGFKYSRAKTLTAGSNMTAVGTLCLQLLGAGKSKEAQDGLKWLQTDNGKGTNPSMDWKKPNSRWPMYEWYYKTQALFQGEEGEGPNWKKWNDTMCKNILKEQEKDGHWETPDQKYGEKKKDGECERADSSPFRSELNIQVYGTCMNALMLTVYYRYLPTFALGRGPATKPAGAAPEKKKDEVEVQIL